MLLVYDHALTDSPKTESLQRLIAGKGIKCLISGLFHHTFRSDAGWQNFANLTQLGHNLLLALFTAKPCSL